MSGVILLTGWAGDVRGDITVWWAQGSPLVILLIWWAQGSPLVMSGADLVGTGESLGDVRGDITDLVGTGESLGDVRGD